MLKKHIFNKSGINHLFLIKHENQIQQIVAAANHSKILIHQWIGSMVDKPGVVHLYQPSILMITLG